LIILCGSGSIYRNVWKVSAEAFFTESRRQQAARSVRRRKENCGTRRPHDFSQQQQNHTMKKFSVQFTMIGNINVECDDKQDAKEFVETVGGEQLLRWLFCQSEIQTMVVNTVAVQELK
jgi:hypothetical protein